MEKGASGAPGARASGLQGEKQPNGGQTAPVQSPSTGPSQATMKRRGAHSHRRPVFSLCLLSTHSIVSQISEQVALSGRVPLTPPRRCLLPPSHRTKAAEAAAVCAVIHVTGYRLRPSKPLAVPCTCCPGTNGLILPTPRYPPAGWGHEKNPPRSVLEGSYGGIHDFHVKRSLSANHCARC